MFIGRGGTLDKMSNCIEMTFILLETLRELNREVHYRGLKDYVQSLKQKEYLNGKQSFILRGALAYLRSIEVDRRSKSLGLIPFFPYDERHYQAKELQGKYLSWYRSVGLFEGE